MVKTMAEETIISSLSAGTLAVLVLILVPVLSFLILFFLFVRRHTRTREAEVHCARCHMLVAMQGVERSPRTLSNHNQSFLPRIPQSSPLPERQPDLQAAHGLVPNIVVRPPKERMEDSATFQRLGMHPRLSESALAVVESEVLSPKASPPMPRHALPTSAQHAAHTPQLTAPQKDAIVSFNETGENCKMNEVRVIEFLSTPLAKTPSNAARKERRKTINVQRTVSPLQPTRRFEHNLACDFEMLEVSRMDRTEVTQGDLEELCETSAGNQEERQSSPYANMLDQSGDARRLRENNALASTLNSGLAIDSSSNAGLLGIGSPCSELLVSAEGSAHTPASVESASRTLTEKSVLEAELEKLKEPVRKGSNNNNTGSCGGRCSNREGEENEERSINLPLSNSRFVTTRDEESMARSSDDVFLAEEESESFKQQVSLQSGAHYVHPLNGHHRAFLESNIEPKLATLLPSLPIKAANAVLPQAGQDGAWANKQEANLPVDPCPAANVDFSSSRGLSRSSSLPVAVKRKNSLVDVIREQQKGKEGWFPSKFESQRGLGSRCPPNFPSDGRRTSGTTVDEAVDWRQ